MCHFERMTIPVAMRFGFTGVTGRRLLVLLVAAGCGTIAATARAGELVVHEWGTFTALQDESGQPVGGINTDDEPVPAFVHDLARGLLIGPTEAPPSFFQGAPSCHPDVTLRLETPVVYFHPAADFAGPVDVRAEFHGGWLTQYFPDAVAVAPGISPRKFGALTEQTVGRLEWKNLTLNAGGAGPQTGERVWTAPRRVEAAMVKTAAGEAERFLFYRGVAHREAPVRVTRSGDALAIADQSGGVRELWLADVRADGSAAFRAITANAPTAATFPAGEYAADTIPRLKASLRTALIAAGLFADEADALLETWSLSYFQSPGLRLFFLVPRAWTDACLPLTIAPRAQVTRVMVGRIELVTPEQRGLLANIAAGPAPDSWLGFRDALEAATIRAGNNRAWNAVMTGQESFAQIAFPVPELYRDYLRLGRFRNALVLDEERRRATPQLAKFIKNFGLEGYAP